VTVQPSNAPGLVPSMSISPTLSLLPSMPSNIPSLISLCEAPRNGYDRQVWNATSCACIDEALSTAMPTRRKETPSPSDRITPRASDRVTPRPTEVAYGNGTFKPSSSHASAVQTGASIKTKSVLSTVLTVEINGTYNVVDSCDCDDGWCFDLDGKCNDECSPSSSPSLLSPTAIPAKSMNRPSSSPICEENRDGCDSLEAWNDRSCACECSTGCFDGDACVPCTEGEVTSVPTRRPVETPCPSTIRSPRRYSSSVG
jgi:hypothetical protein